MARLVFLHLLALITLLLTSYAEQTPYFPPQPPSCPICAAKYSSISSCAAACSAFINFTSIIFNPAQFIDVVKCTCTDTFQAVFPQCADCFLQTNQSQFINAPNIPAVINGIRQVCAVQSVLFGNVTESNGQVTPPPPSPSPTSAAIVQAEGHFHVAAVAVAAGIAFLSLVT